MHSAIYYQDDSGTLTRVVYLSYQGVYCKFISTKYVDRGNDGIFLADRRGSHRNLLLVLGRPILAALNPRTTYKFMSTTILEFMRLLNMDRVNQSSQLSILNNIPSIPKTEYTKHRRVVAPAVAFVAIAYAFVFFLAIAFQSFRDGILPEALESCRNRLLILNARYGKDSMKCFRQNPTELSPRSETGLLNFVRTLFAAGVIPILLLWRRLEIDPLGLELGINSSDSDSLSCDSVELRI